MTFIPYHEKRVTKSRVTNHRRAPLYHSRSERPLAPPDVLFPQNPSCGHGKEQESDHFKEFSNSARDKQNAEGLHLFQQQHVAR